MKQKLIAVLAGAAGLALASPALAQMGMEYFKKPAIADIFRPVVGGGAIYETEQDQKKTPMEMSVVATDTVDGKEAFWLEYGHPDQKTGLMTYAKMLVTKDDFQFHRVIFQQPGQAQPMEMAVNPAMHQQSQAHDEMAKWHNAGTETITVPAGTFSCDHWTRDDGKGDVWTSAKISPMAMVKETTPGRSMVLVKVLTDAQDHITGTPMKMDMQQMMQQRMQQRQQQRPQP